MLPTFCLIALLGINGELNAQIPKSTIAEDTLSSGDSMRIDTIAQDSIIEGAFSISETGFDDPVYYEAKDSMYLDMVNKALHLYGEAQIKYTSIQLKAYHIIYHWESGLMEAFHGLDSLDEKLGLPEFQDGNQNFISERMKYNFKTEKGLVYEVVTKEQDVYIRGAKTKFTRKQLDTSKQDIIYSTNAIFTSCNHEVPHYGIRSNKQKIIPNKEVIIGPSVLEIQSVPTPLVLPFGFFPITSKRSAGLLIPNDYSYNDNWGFGIEELGFYYPVNDRMDITLLSNYYFNGTWGTRSEVSYKKRYKYTGGLNIEYNQIVSELSNSTIKEQETSYSLQWSHSQSPEAHPTISLNGNISLRGNNNDQRTNFDYRTQTENQVSSNLSLTKSFPYAPFSLSVNVSNSQNIQTRVMDLTLPSLQFNMTKIFPFQQKERVGRPKWYEDIYLQYDLDADNRIRTTDTALFSSETLDRMTYGAGHSVSTGKSIRLFKYFSLNPRISYDEVWNFQSLERFATDSIVNAQDTVVIDGEIVSIKNRIDTIVNVENVRRDQFHDFRAFRFSTDLKTKLFSTMLFEKGWLRGIRHTISPSFSFNYQPEMGDFNAEFNKLLISSKDTTEYNITDQFAYQRVNPREQMTLSYSFSDLVQGKKFNRKDSLVEKFDIIKNISFSGNYDFLKDSLQFSNPVFSVRTPLFETTSFDFRWSWSLYQQDEDGRAIDKLYIDESNRLLRSLGGAFSVNTNFTIPQLRKMFNSEAEEGKSENELVNLLNSIKFSHRYDFTFVKRTDGIVGSVSANTLNLNGNIPLTDSWKINVGNVGWDFLAQRITYPDIGFSRDLHCWEMNMQWQPDAGAYRFTIKVKPGTMEFLELPYNRNPYETGF